MSPRVPRGVIVAGLGKRFFAAVLDALPLLIIAGLQVLVVSLTPAPAIRLVAVLAGGVLAAGYGLYQWWAYASRGAGLGARAMGLSVVSLRDGEPIGWWRFFLRQLVFSALMGTVVGGIALLVFLVIHERHQGWHDMVAGAVVVQPKPSEARPAATGRRAPAPSTVGLPPHLTSSFSPQPGTTSGYAPTPAPEWLPGVREEPLHATAAQQPWQPGPAQPMQPAGTQAMPQQPWGAGAPHQGAPVQPAATALPGAHAQPNGGLPSAPGPGQRPPEPTRAQFPPSTPEPGRAEFPPPLPEPTPSPRPAAQSWIPVPTPSSVIEPARSVRVRKRDFGEVEEDEGTRISAPATAARRPGGEGWYVRLDDGREVELTVTVLLGRNPQKGQEDPAEVHLVPASGDGRMISRTHVLIGTDPRGVFVVDRGSTNGTALVTTGGELEPCPSGTQVRVRDGQQVSYGNRWFTVLRRPAL